MTAVQPRASNFTPVQACSIGVGSLVSYIRYSSAPINLFGVSWSTIDDRLPRATHLSFLKTRLVRAEPARSGNSAMNFLKFPDT